MQFLATAGDALAEYACGFLHTEFSADMEIVVRDSFVPKGAVLFFSSDGNFPSKCIRHVRPGDATTRGIACPNWVPEKTRLIAISKRLEIDNPKKDDKKRLQAALMDAYAAVTGIRQPRRRKHRSKSRHSAAVGERLQEHMAEYE